MPKEEWMAALKAVLGESSWERRLVLKVSVLLAVGAFVVRGVYVLGHHTITSIGRSIVLSFLVVTGIQIILWIIGIRMEIFGTATDEDYTLSSATSDLPTFEGPFKKTLRNLMFPELPLENDEINDLSLRTALRWWFQSKTFIERESSRLTPDDEGRIDLMMTEIRRILEERQRQQQRGR